ncbi:hypothetical protein B9Z55_026419 [Caenorhabditis nigoni]|uniref:3'-5' exonuclease domain-containing protein n=1 Tax=Caenorhabditis nigoni TaxID=1611254 RepID=A0A2G5T3B3_9PELO|nr:hypothetical protein B9Z55_026419 [Caenorhabditis nigoni]
MVPILEKLSEEDKLTLPVAVDLTAEVLKVDRSYPGLPRWIRESLNAVLEMDLIYSDYGIKSKLIRLVNRRREVTEEDIIELKQLTFEMVSTMSERELEGYDIKITDKIEVVDNVLKTMEQTTEMLPVYLDVENTYGFLGERHWRSKKFQGVAALVIILDPINKEVLLWRLHKTPELDDVRDRLKELSLYRKILTWGEESILEGIENKKNIQQTKLGNLVSLKSAAEEAGLFLLKLETMSNWTNEILRRDQIIYAALDCLAMVRIVEHFKIPIS